MQIPEKRVCDLCKAEVTGAAYVAMSYPLDEADRARVRDSLKATPNPYVIIGLTFDAVPNSWRFDFCRGCADGFMPMLADLKTQAIAAWLTERQRRAEAPVGESGE